jgi:hypothetical protein
MFEWLFGVFSDGKPVKYAQSRFVLVKFWWKLWGFAEYADMTI